MKKTILAVSLSLTCSLIAHAQKAEGSTSTEVSNQTSAAAKQAGKSINLDSGTHLSGQLQNTIDAHKARVGDQVILKTTQAIKSEGRTVVNKGSRLVGHITEVAQLTKGKGESRIGILFDRLEQGTLQVPITATITSIINVRASAANNQDLFASDVSTSGSASSSSGARSSSAGSSAGLLGGVGGVVNSTPSTVGSAVEGTTSAGGSTVNSTTGVVGNTAAGVGQSLGGIQISQSSNASVEGSSVLSLQGQNLRLEKGTNFNLVLTQSANAGTSPNQ
jgi:hypothetical protein